MATKSEIETFIVESTQKLGHFQVKDPSILDADLTHEFIDAGFALLQYYQNTNDVNVDDSIIGAFVDCAVLMNVLADDALLDEAIRQHAGKTMVSLENLVTAITHAVEKNIAAQR